MGGRGVGPAAERAGAVRIADVGRLAAGGLARAVVGEAVGADAEPDRVDEHRGRPIGLAEAAFQHLHVEGELVALELGRLQHDHDVGDRRAVLAEHRGRGVGRVLGEAAGAPDLDHLRCRHVAHRAHRAAGEQGRGRLHAVQDQLVAFQLAGLGVEHDQRRRISPVGRHADRLRVRPQPPSERAGAGAGVWVWATADPAARIKAAARRLHVCCAFIATGPSFPGRPQPRLV